MRFRFTTLILAVLVATAVTWSAAVTLDETAGHQTIEGFGAFGGMMQWWGGGPFHNSTFVDMLINDLGLTMLRMQTDGYDFETTNDNADPNVLNMGGYNTTSSKMALHFPYFRALKAEADARGEPLRVIGSIWSPPSWMKTNNSVDNGGHLRTTAYAEFGEYMIAFITAMKQGCDIDLYAVSIANEPAFEEPYASCVYTADEYRDAIKVMGPMIHNAFPNMRLFGAEDMLASWSRPGAFPGPLMADPDSRAEMHALAVHGYSDGVHPTPTSQAALIWGRAARNCASANAPLWMTETSGYGSDWTGAFQYAEAIFAALKYGKISAWVFWTIAQTAGDRENYRLMLNNVPNKKYYVSKQYYRYIRPGAIMLECTSDDPEVLSIAFHHAANRTLTYVLLNTSSSAKTVTLAGGGDLPTFEMYRSTAGQDCSSVGTHSSGNLSLPASSITTLCGQGYDRVAVSGGHSRMSRTRLAAIRGRGTVLCGLDGRVLGSGTVGSGSRRAMPGVNGVYIVRTRYGFTVPVLGLHR